jgi:negative regulator of replication initiation
MNSIEIDNQVFAELERRASGFNTKPNDVLRRILGLSNPPPEQPTIPKTSPKLTPPSSTVIEFIKSERFQRHQQAIDRYLALLGWLYAAHSKQFAEAALKFHRGSRAYFAKSEKEILEGGENVTADQIPQSPFWTLTRLDNKSKRQVLRDILFALGYVQSDVNFVLTVIPDSGIRRNHGSYNPFLTS